jgi:putative alpha-1,2-mannosidase
MSAWYVFSALGFYPVNPIAAEYILGVPAFATSTIKLQTGRTLQIIADPKKRFVNKVLLNGRPLNRIFITHKELLGGGTLEFVMSDRAGGRWGINCETAPH